LTKEEFILKLHQALLSLYDNAAMRKSPLAGWLGLESRPNPSLALQELIASEIRALKPGLSVPLDSNPQRLYKILQYRYIEQLGQKEAAGELLLSVRHLRRLEQQALREFAETLWRKYGLAPQESMQDAPGEPANQSPAAATDRELAWARESLPDETIGPRALLDAVVHTLEPLLRSRRVRFTVQVEEGLPPLSGKVGLIRQALAGLLARVLERCPGGEIALQAGWAGEAVSITVTGTLDCGAAEPPVRETAPAGKAAPAELAAPEELFEPGELTRALVQAFGGQLTITQTPSGATTSSTGATASSTGAIASSTGAAASSTGAAIQAEILFPSARVAPVVMVDDNADALQLVERFLSGSRYGFVGTREPAQAIDLAAQIRPGAIVLDVMLPGIDGWELLGRLREHPATSRTPVVVCTFLDQEALALALGAAAFIQKPLTREGLLGVLDQVISRPAPSLPAGAP
jgi:CheY-like chemotaxis protein